MLRSFLSQSRRVFVLAEGTPNPNALIFYPQGQPVLGKLEGKSVIPVSYTSREECGESMLAQHLFKCHGVAQVLLDENHITVSKEAFVDWNLVRPSVELAISQFFACGFEVIRKEALEKYVRSPKEMTEREQEIVQLIDQRVKPFVQSDGGDIEFIELVDGFVYVELRGACSGCPKSSITLKMGIERLIQHQFPEIKGVRNIEDSEAE